VAEIVKLATASTESTSERLIDELRAVIMKPEYDMTAIATVLGVLVMLQHEFLERNSA
jgi:hypothetical protein